VIYHSGREVENGHYIADVLQGEQWFRCDDDTILSIEEPIFWSRNVYMLFYMRVDE
jgi:ubiquitin carboxyl-terminal hydrolase 22/27/51